MIAENYQRNSYIYYQSALKGVFGPVHENDPQCGYYRMRRGRGGPWVPVAIWKERPGSLAPSENSENSDSGKLVCLVDGVSGILLKSGPGSADIRFPMRPMWQWLNGAKFGLSICLI